MKVKYYMTSSGRSPVEEFLDDCSDDVRNDYFDAVNLLTEGHHLTMPLNRPLFDIHAGLHELRFKDAAGQVRFVYYIKKGDAIYMLHAFKKKTQKLPQKEVELILKRLKEV
jgi:phage-related protein